MLWCIRCKKHTDTIDEHTVISKNGRPRKVGVCAICGTKKSVFISGKKKLEQGKGIMNWGINNLPFEAHMIDQGDDGKIRRASFAGPGTNLKKRLNPDDTPKEWSKPINKLDEGAYHHDLCYRDYTDVSTRNKCDETLERVADQVINNPRSTTIQKTNATLVKGIMKTKRTLKA